MFKRVIHIIHSETIAGIFLIISVIFALFLSNSYLAPQYDHFFNERLFGIHTLHYWINHALMAIFFFAIGLEVKEQFLFGDLNSIKKATLPGFAALGGMVVPGICFLLITRHAPEYWHAWAVPIATDIAFSLAILKLVGRCAPLSLKYFLLALATFDDLGAVAVIAVFYTAHVQGNILLIGTLLFLSLCLLNYYWVRFISLYMVLGIFLWIALSKSGIDAAVTGVLVAFTIPLKGEFNRARDLHKNLMPWINTLVLPAFALANTGIYFHQLSRHSLFSSLPLGIFFGLVVGKPLGVMSFTWAAVRLRLGKLPELVDWSLLFGVALICGIGFTISFVVGELAFAQPAFELRNEIKISIFAASILSAILSFSWFILRGKYVK